MVMNILTWNISGILSSKSRLRRILNKYRASVVALPNSFNNAPVGGKVWLFWMSDFDFEVVSVSDKAIIGWLVRGDV